MIEESKDTEPATEGPLDPDCVYEGNYKWPSNLYIEMRDMGAMAFMTYAFGYILETARRLKKEGKEMIGLHVDDDGSRLSRSAETGSNNYLGRSFTPAEVKQIVQDNIESLQRFSYLRFNPKMVELMYNHLDILQERANSSSDERAITLEEYDDKFQDRELVYAVTKDSISKRITLIFRGTDAKLAFYSNWATNFSIVKEKVSLPETFSGKINEENAVNLHIGFYDYIFGKTVDTTDDENKTKFDQILEDLKPLLEKYPDHKLYVTGHSLGGALSTVASFFLAADPTIPKPVSCINFASPRVGDENFLKACQHLEKTRQLRILRCVNDKDSVAAIPTIGYEHVGFQVTTYKDGWIFKACDPVISYPNFEHGYWDWFKMSLDNSFITSLNCGYDHSDYRERVELATDFLQTKNLNLMYADPDLVGYKLE